MDAPVSTRRILGLAVPALGALAAEPLYVLVDTAVVGHLGAAALGGVALGGSLMATATWLCNFLAYGTTGRTARLYGAGRRREAVAEGVQATWLALGVGVLLVVAGLAGAPAAIRILAGDDPALREAATAWLRIAVLGAPFILVSLAGLGWMRGVQDVRRPLWFLIGANAASAAASPLLVYGLDLGVRGSAVANVLAQGVAAALFVRALLAERPPLRPSWARMRPQIAVARDLALRTAAMQACFLSAAAVAARMGADRIAAHQIALQLWIFLALVLDSLAIAAQSLVGERLGAGDAGGARAVARSVARLGGLAGGVLALALLAGWTVIPRAFTDDDAVLAQAHVAWPWFVAMQPLAGVLFALDGVLIGAGDVTFMRNVTIVAAVGGFLPLTFLAYGADLGLAGIWAGLLAFVVIRLAGGLWRTAGARWTVTGASVSGRSA